MRVVMPSILIVLGVLLIIEAVIGAGWVGAVVGVLVILLGIAGLLRFRHQRLTARRVSPAWQAGDSWDPRNPENRDRTRLLTLQLRERLLKWDPIGVGTSPEARSEYDSLISPLMHQLHDGASVEEIYAWLSEKHKHFGTTPNPPLDKTFAASLVDWWASSTGTETEVPR
jgi:hypothetical protein